MGSKEKLIKFRNIFEELADIVDRMIESEEVEPALIGELVIAMMELTKLQNSIGFYGA